MFTGFAFSAASLSFDFQQLTPFFLVMLAAAIIGCAPLRPLTLMLGAAAKQEGELPPKENFVQAALYVAAFVLLLWCIIRLSGGSYNPFIYFRF